MMDCRVKPGNDVRGNCGVELSIVIARIEANEAIQLSLWLWIASLRSQ